MTRKKYAWIGRALAAALAVLLFAAGSAGAETLGFARLADSTNVRSGTTVKGGALDPGNVIYRLKEGDIVYVFDTQVGTDGDTWYHITCQYNDDGTLRARQGWISSKTAECGLYRSVVSVSAGNTGFLALKEDGTVCGAARLGSRTSSFYRDIAALEGVASVRAGDDFYACVFENGQEYTLGREPGSNPVHSAGTVVLDVFQGERSILTREGGLFSTADLHWVWPKSMPDLTGVWDAVQKQGSLFLLMEDGTVACASFESGVFFIMGEDFPDFSALTGIVSIDTVLWHPQDVYFYEVFAAVREDGTAWISPRAVEILTDGWTDLKQIALAADYLAGVRKDGRVYAAGRSQEIVAEVSAWTEIAAVSCADTYCVGLKYDGTLVFAGEVDFE